jgi:hypothetical protein
MTVRDCAAAAPSDCDGPHDAGESDLPTADSFARHKDIQQDASEPVTNGFSSMM